MKLKYEREKQQMTIRLKNEQMKVKNSEESYLELENKIQ